MWSKPIKDLAPDFGISDVALAKFCRKHSVPLPGRGYWAKLKAGKPVMAFTLPPRGLGQHETISIGHDEWRRRDEQEARLREEEIPPPPEFPETLVELRQRVAKLVGKVTYLKGLDRTHRVVAALLEADKARIEKRSASSYPSIFDEPFFSSPYERRRLKLLNSIFLALAKLDVSAFAQGKNPSDFEIRVGDSSLTLRLDDPKIKKERESWRPSSDIRRPASDPLQMSISWHLEKVDGLRLLWSDSKEAAIEGFLREIVVELVVAGDMQIRMAELRHHAWRVQRKADLIEAARKREEEARQKEIARLQRLEKARIDQLFEDAICLRLSNDLRAYVEAVQVANTSSETPVSEQEMSQWIVWALAQADRIDPVRTHSLLRQVVDTGEESEKDGARPLTQGQSDLELAKSAWHPNRWYTRLHR
ncbi:hypothetical protein GCM10010080_24880 [Thermomonas carbonis]|nr:hypothetical protein GCM10010080_24880 [Thermomonas carbonis]